MQEPTNEVVLLYAFLLFRVCRAITIVLYCHSFKDNSYHKKYFLMVTYKLILIIFIVYRVCIISNIKSEPSNVHQVQSRLYFHINVFYMCRPTLDIFMAYMYVIWKYHYCWTDIMMSICVQNISTAQAVKLHYQKKLCVMTVAYLQLVRHSHQILLPYCKQ